MNPVNFETREAVNTPGLRGAGELPAELQGNQTGTGWERFPSAPLALSMLLLLFPLFPPVRDNPRLGWTFVGVAGSLLTWTMILWAVGKSRGLRFAIEWFPVKSHYVQACVQFSIMLYWGWYWERVYPEIPLIVSQAVFLYALDALLSWSRGRKWRLGFGPLPIVVSTNLLLWFRHDVYYMQFLMLTTGALAKQFITWEREGKRTHIFNPSAFGQFLFALGLIATATTEQLTWGEEIAQTFDVPHMLVVIFLGGIVVQYLFHVTLMTFAAAVTLLLLNLGYYKITGVYYFVNINIAAPIFLGIHLLITDPATSPRTYLGRVIFGTLYGGAYFALFRVLEHYEIPLFWDKLLPVPILNLCVPLIEKGIRSGWIGKLNQRWANALPPRRLNLVHMSCWAMFFIGMCWSGFIEAPHPGNSILFWKKAYVDGKIHAGHSLVMAAGSQAEGGGSGAAYNELGLICMEGKIVNENHATAAKHFAKACELGDQSGCVNVAIQFLFMRQWRSDETVARALELLEQDCLAGGSGRSCYLLGFAYESGRGRPLDPGRAVDFYEQAGVDNLYVVKGLARLALTGTSTPYDVRPLVGALATAAKDGDAESCWYLAYMYRDNVWLRPDIEKARAMLQKACEYGSMEACEVLKTPELPPYSHPVMNVPGFATAFPLE